MPKSQPTPSKLKSSPPSPFSIPPSELRTFLDALDPQHVYITHVDTHPRGFKARIFTVPILMNLVIAGLLVWRAVVILPYYVMLLMAIWGYDNDLKVDFDHIGWNGIMNILWSRVFIFMLDFTIVKILLPWPIDFFFGLPANPVAWRMSVGFQDQEVGVRRSRRWDQTLPKDWLSEEADGKVYQERIMPAIDRTWVRTKTSYLMMDKSWDLDFDAMIRAHDLLKAGTNRLSDFQKTVIVHSEDHGWMVWQVWKLDEGAEDEGRKKIVMFKDKLTAMGKENLFFRWIELIQYETSQPGGFTAERQAQAMRQARELFESQGVDFDQFWEEMGGVGGLPGMEDSS